MSKYPDTVRTQAGGAHVHVDKYGEHMFAGTQHKHAWRACARSTYLHTLIENQADLFSHVSSKHHISMHISELELCSRINKCTCAFNFYGNN